MFVTMGSVLLESSVFCAFFFSKLESRDKYRHEGRA